MELLPSSAPNEFFQYACPFYLQEHNREVTQVNIDEEAYIWNNKLFRRSRK
jgi:hypothetical protein